MAKSKKKQLQEEFSNLQVNTTTPSQYSGDTNTQKTKQNTTKQVDKKKVDKNNLAGDILKAAPSFLKTIGDGIAQPYNYLSRGLAETAAYDTKEQKGARDAQTQLQSIDTKLIKTAGERIRDPNVSPEAKARWRELIKKSSASKPDTSRTDEVLKYTDPAKGAASVASIGLDVATAGMATSGVKGAKIALQTGGRRALAKELIKQSVKTGAIAAPSGAAQPFIEKGSKATPEDVIKGAATGFGIGAVLPGGAYAASKLVPAASRVASKVVDKTLDTTEKVAASRAGKAAKAVKDYYVAPKVGFEPKKTEAIPDLSPEEVKSMTPQKVTVADKSKKSDVIVATPSNPEAKQPHQLVFDGLKGKEAIIKNDAGKAIKVKISPDGKSFKLAEDLLHDGQLVAKKGASEINGVPNTLGDLGEDFVKKGKIEPVHAPPPEAIDRNFAFGETDHKLATVVPEKQFDNMTSTETQDAIGHNRPADVLQTKIEKARAEGDMHTAAELEKQLPDQAMNPDAPGMSADAKASAMAKSTSKTEEKSVSRVYNRLKAEHPELKDDVSYEATNLKKEAEKAVELIAEDKQKAFRIATGQETSPDLTSTSTNIAMAERALEEGNTDLFARLVKNRSLAQTRRGQELVAEKASITDNSTSRYVKELLGIKLDKLSKRYLSDVNIKNSKEKITKVIDNEVSKLEKRIKAKTLDAKSAILMLEKLECI